jgi:EamA-like transporter family
MQAGDLGRLIVLAGLWGGSFLFIRVAAPVLGPVVLVELRVLIAGLALLLYAAFTRRALDLRARWRQYLIIGALNTAIPFVPATGSGHATYRHTVDQRCVVRLVAGARFNRAGISAVLSTDRRHWANARADGNVHYANLRRRMGRAVPGRADYD